MEQKKIMGRLLLVLIVISVIIPTILMIRDKWIEDDVYHIQIYYMESTNNMKAVHTTIPWDTSEQMIRSILNKLYISFPKENLNASIASDIEVTKIEIEDTIATLFFSKTYMEQTVREELTTRLSIVWSLTSLEFIEGVLFEIDNEPFLTMQGEEYGIMNRQNTIIEGGVSATTTEYDLVKLYFKDTEDTMLIPENRLVEVEANKGKERTILEQLILGAREEGSVGTIPPETQIKEVNIASDGVCYVNLSQEFITKYHGIAGAEELTIYSIVNSLCELDTIHKVQFLIEGERIDTFKGNTDFNKPFEPREIY